MTSDIKLNLECEFLTPAFLGDANQQAKLRTVPFKGMLRWWYRQIYGTSEEDKIFGSTTEASKIKIEVIGDLKEESHNLRDLTLKWLAYGGEKRKILPTNKSFTWKISYPQEFETKIKNVLLAFHNFGNIGLKSRNGFGSLHIKNLQKAKIDIPDSNWFETKDSFSNWEKALECIGSIYKDDKLKFYRQMINRKNKFKEGRYPKHLFLKIIRIENKYKGRVLVLKKSGEEFERIINSLKSIDTLEQKK
jgi:CRISPR-associated protein Cmr1